MGSRRSAGCMSPGVREPWQLTVEDVALSLLASGFGFVYAYLLLRLPNHWAFETLPAPAWPFWAGAACVVTGLALYAMARCTAPIYVAGPDTPSADPKPVRTVTATQLWCCAAFMDAMVTTSLVSSSSAYRWRPMWFLLLPIIVVPVVMGIRGRLVTCQSDVRAVADSSSTSRC